MLPLITRNLEWVADTKVQRSILPIKGLYPTLILWAVGIMNLHTEVKTKDNIGEIEADAKTGVETKLLIEAIEVEDLFGVAILGITEIPDITHIKEDGSIKYPP